MRTIAVTVPNGWAVRDYLLSGFLSELSSAAKVVVLSPLASDPEFQKAFSSERLELEELNLPESNWFEREVERLLTYANYFRHDTVMGRNAMAFRDGAPRRMEMRFLSRIKVALVRPLANFLARHVFRHLPVRGQAAVERLAYRRLFKESRRLEAVFEEHRVDLLFSTMPLISTFDRPAIWAAERLGVPMACAIPGWDNLHSKSQLPAEFSLYLVWSDWMARILRDQYPAITEESIAVTGPLFLDFCCMPELTAERSEFLRSFGGSPERPLVVWACAPRAQTPHQAELIREFLTRLRTSSSCRNPQLLVRPHPVGGSAYLESLGEEFPEVMISEVHDSGRGDRWFPRLDDVEMLVNSVVHADVLVGFSSTITLECFAVDTPVVNIAFDHVSGSDYERVTRGAYRTESYRPVVDMEATRIAWSQEELLEHVNAFLGDPSDRREERAQLLRVICGDVDGKAAVRAASVLHEAADVPRHPSLRS